MSETTALATYDDNMLDLLAGLASPADMVAQSGPDMLKINYDEDSIHPRGVWLIGQKKKDNAIIEEGTLVDRVVILAVRNRYSFYDEDKKVYINTETFEAGGQPSDKAEVAAKVAKLGGELKFQFVLYGLAVVNGSFKEFVSYLGGSAYTAIKAHLVDLSTIITPTRKITAPLFASLTILGECEKKKSGATTFWVPSFKKGPLFTKEQIEYFKSKRDEVESFIVHQSVMNAERKRKDDTAPAATGPSSEMYTPPVDTMPDISAMKSLVPDPPKVGDDIPFKAAPEASGDDFDIESAMKAILGR
jgi:hypothetical protein